MSSISPTIPIHVCEPVPRTPTDGPPQCRIYRTRRHIYRAYCPVFGRNDHESPYRSYSSPLRVASEPTSTHRKLAVTQIACPGTLAALCGIRNHTHQRGELTMTNNVT